MLSILRCLGCVGVNDEVSKFRRDAEVANLKLLIKAVEEKSQVPTIDEETLETVISDYCKLLRQCDALIGDYQKLEEEDSVQVFKIMQKILDERKKGFTAYYKKIKDSYNRQLITEYPKFLSFQLDLGNQLKILREKSTPVTPGVAMKALIIDQKLGQVPAKHPSRDFAGLPKTPRPSRVDEQPQSPGVVPVAEVLPSQLPIAKI